MRAVVAAGGSGSRMAPVTRFLNKHLIPVGDGRLMIDYPLNFLKKSGFDTVSIVTGSNHATQIVEYVGDGESHGFKSVSYFFQPKPLGIADIFKRIGPHDEGVLLILGDNYFEVPLDLHFIWNTKACAFEYDIGSKDEARRFGQAIRFEDGSIERIVEKPEMAAHSRILTGLYYFPPDVFSYVEELSPSARNELEITHLLQRYLEMGSLIVKEVEGKWADLGEWPSWKHHVKS